MSNATDHLALARDYIAKGDNYYAKAADEIAAWLDEDLSRTQAEAATALGKTESYISRLLRARKTGERPDWSSGSNKRDEVASKVLADPEQRRQVIASLPPAQVEAIIEDANEVAIERSRAHYAERNTTPRPPNAGDLTGGEMWDPSESWADTLILRVDTNTRALENHVRQWGLVVGSLNDDDALAYVEQSERRLAEVRAALQERARDRAREEV